MTDVHLLGISGWVAFAVGLGRYAYITVKRVIDAVAFRVGFIFWMNFFRMNVRKALDSRQRVGRHGYIQGLCRAYLSGDVITAINMVHKDIVGSMLTINMYIGIASDVRHTGTAKHLSLRIFQRS